jgi:hypothetical protein
MVSSQSPMVSRARPMNVLPKWPLLGVTTIMLNYTRKKTLTIFSVKTWIGAHSFNDLPVKARKTQKCAF